ncbi:MAG: 5-(carboxyamino)imidazole ribonucleotide synthase, partial [Bdellovibrionales bacterium]|nr:5-(carboxyamino)imidazole ribonucleotide synthase [Oligoflexia bacterium]
MKKIAAPLGIIGDGQLALMLGEAASAQGFDFLGFGTDGNSPFA